MTLARLPAALLGLLILPAPLPAQERATGTTTIDRPAPPPRGVTIEQGGVPLTGTVTPGQAVDIRGANVVIVEDTPRITRLTVRNDVLFDFDKSDLRPEASDALGRVAEIIRQRSPRAVSIVGHTDSIGDDAYNQTLSERRARSVEQWLTAHAQDLPSLQATGRGEREPVAPNTVDGRDNPDGRQQNRRVEVLLQR